MATIRIKLTAARTYSPGHGQPDEIQTHARISYVGIDPEGAELEVWIKYGWLDAGRWVPSVARAKRHDFVNVKAHTLGDGTQVPADNKFDRIRDTNFPTTLIVTLFDQYLMALYQQLIADSRYAGTIEIT